MISFTEAFSQVFEQIQPPGTEQEEILATVGRVVADALFAAVDSPPVNVSLKKGYALVSPDVEKASPENSILLHIIVTILSCPSHGVCNTPLLLYSQVTYLTPVARQGD